jgi:hypothetical protein
LPLAEEYFANFSQRQIAHWRIGVHHYRDIGIMALRRHDRAA